MILVFKTSITKKEARKLKPYLDRILPNIAHWHGASADTEFVQIAVTNMQNGPTVWLAAVTDAQYNSPTTNEGKSTR